MISNFYPSSTDTEDSLAYFPRVLRIEPASQCNLSCSHCPTGTINMVRGLMSSLTFSNILKNIEENKDYIKTIVLYHGGEPLLNKDFFHYVSEIKSVNEKFFIKTVSNGMALTESISEKLLTSDLNQVEFSIDGISAEESEFIREKSKTKKILENIKTLLKLKKIRKNKKLEVAIATTQFHRSKSANVFDEVKTPNWLKEFFGDEVSYKPSYAVRWPHMGDSGKFDYLHTTGEDRNECDHVNSTLTVRYDGNVVPCCYDLTSQLVMGNVNDQSLREIWINSKYKNLRDSIKNKKFISICNNCATVKPPVYLIPNWS